MKKVILVDGNNLLFRSYYATAYSGNLMKNSKGFPTNGLFGFVNMMNKIIHEDKPDYLLVAFDMGKTFRHEKYSDYKGGRDETPLDLKRQFPVAKKILNAMHISYLEVERYEADDIIGTYAKMIDEEDGYEGLIVSSDKDLLQLITDKVSVKLLKTKDYVMMDPLVFQKTYGVEPSGMIDLKGLMGDSSDNIPGVKGIGEKTAIKLLREYHDLDNLYDHIDCIKGATKNKLIEGRDSAFESREIATIFKRVPVCYSLEDLKFKDGVSVELVDLYNELEFYSFLKKLDTPNVSDEVSYEIVSSDDIEEIREDVSLYVDMDMDNYHKANIIGISIYNENVHYYIPKKNLKSLSFLRGNVFCYDVKKNYCLFKRNHLEIPKMTMDVMIASYLLNYNVKDDIAHVASSFGYEIEFYQKREKLTEEEIYRRSMKKARFIYEIIPRLLKEMQENEVFSLYHDIEFPLSFVLARMELEGIRIDMHVLDAMGEEIQERIHVLEEEIYDLSGVSFNISSPKQLGEVLFERLALPHGKKKKTGYSTDEATLSKLKDYPVVSDVLEYRMLSKLYSTYIEGLKNNVLVDGKIHTIYTQTLTRTGRLSSIEPNLQNIPIRSEYGRLIRKAFVPDGDGYLLSSDYSQIELRIFAHLADVDALRQAFLNGDDIHTKTASNVYGVSYDEVTSDMRRSAKAVNFGIIYGISSYGLAGDLHISPKEAKEFIERYFTAFPGIKTYMDSVIKKAHEDGYVKTIMNRKRVIDEIHNSNYMIRSMGERMALNTPIQGSSADILKKAMIEIDRRFEELGLKSKMLLQIHDELDFNVYSDELDIVKKEVKNIMENTVKLSVPLKVEISVGKNLYEAK